MRIKKLSQIAISISIFVLGSQSILAQTKPVSNKAKLANQLVNLTNEGFPADAYEDLFKSANGEVFTGLRDALIKSFTEGIENDSKLSVAQKEKYKENVPELAEKLSTLFVSKIGDGINVKKWTNEILFAAYSKYTVAEINKLLVFFKRAAGESFLKYNRDVADRAFAKSIGAEPELDLRYVVEIEKFLKSAVGKKFYDTLMKWTADRINERIETWRENYLKGLDRNEFEEAINEFKAKYATKE